MSFSEQQLKSTQAQDLNVKCLHTILPQVSWLPSKRNPNTYHTIFSDAPDAHTFKSKLQSAITKYKLPLTVKINKTKTAALIVNLSGVTAESLALLAEYQSHCNSINFKPIELTSVNKERLISELNKGNLDSCKIILAEITKLSIFDKLTETGLKTLVEVLKGNTTLTSFELGDNKIDTASAKDLADALKANTTLTSLYLQRNNIGAAGAKDLADALKANTTLTLLRLGDNNIGAAGAKDLADALKANTTLTSLILKDNNIGAAGAKELADALKANTTLTSLRLTDNNIGDAGVKDLADALKENTTLTSLDLGFNNIGADGAKDLADALKVNNTLTSLMLWNNNIGDAGAKDLVDALKANTTLTSLCLGFNNISDAGAKDLADALKANTTLTSLYLLRNNIGDAGAKELADALEENPTLIELDLGENDISHQPISHIKVSTTRNKTFKPNIELMSLQLVKLLTEFSNVPTIIAQLMLDYAKDFTVEMMESFTNGRVQNMTFPASTKHASAEVVEDDEDYDHKKNPPLSQSRVSIATSSSSFHYHSPAQLASSTSSSSDMSFSEQQLKSTQAQDLNVKRLHIILPQVSWLRSRKNQNTYHTIFSDALKAHTFKSKLQSAITKYKLPLTVKINKTKTAAFDVSLSGVTAESLALLAKHQSYCNSINFKPIELTSVKEEQLISELNNGNLDSCKIFLTDITKLSIFHKLTETGLKTLVEVLKENTTLTLFVLGNNKIDTAGAKDLADALKANTTLTSLDLRNNNIDAAGAKELADVLKANTTLTSLNLGFNNISAAGAKDLADALKANTTLTSLELRGNNIGAAGAKELADALKANNTLTSLGLRDNNIAAAGAKDLADALKENTTLTSLNLDNNNIGAAGAKDLADALRANTTLTSLDLWNNNISDAGAKDLADALKANTTLTSLNLIGNNISAVGAKDLAEALEENATLIELALLNNNISDQQISLIEVSTTRNKTFKPNIKLMSHQLVELFTEFSNVPTVIAQLMLDYAKDFTVAMMESFTKGRVQNMTFPTSTKYASAEVVKDDEDYDHKKNPPLSQSRVSIATTSVVSIIIVLRNLLPQHSVHRICLLMSSN